MKLKVCLTMLDIKKLLRPRRLFLIGIAYTAFITFLFLFPATHVPKVEVPSFDKIGHILIFSLLVIVWASFARVSFQKNTHKIYWVLVFAFFYGIIIEALQKLFFASRTADGWDLVANVVGILIGWIAFNRINKVFAMKY